VGGVSWLQRATAQSVSDGVDTLITFTEMTYNYAGVTISGTSVLFSSAGLYRIDASVEAGTGNKFNLLAATIRKNGAAVANLQIPRYFTNAIDTYEASLDSVVVVSVSTADYVELFVNCNTASGNADITPRFVITKLT